MNDLSIQGEKNQEKKTPTTLPHPHPPTTEKPKPKQINKAPKEKQNNSNSPHSINFLCWLGRDISKTHCICSSY